jgi:hypothetical protein
LSDITITRTDINLPTEAELVSVRKFLFDCFRGFTQVDDKKWRRFWKAFTRKEPGEMAEIEMVFPRSGPFHRRHMKIKQSVFDAQERFDDFEQFRYWLKVGAAWVMWAAGPKGGVIPIPKSVSYKSADDAEFQEFHVKVIGFLRGEHAAKYLWPHLKDKAFDMMDSILNGFDE